MATINAGNSAVKRAAENPALALLERLGYIVRGALYGVMGLLALGIALSVGSGQATDLSGSLVFLIANPFGKLVLVVVAIGLSAYSLWGFTRAVYDPLHRGRGAGGYMARLGFVTSALSYAAIVVFALRLLFGTSGTSGDSNRTTIAAILTHPGGGWLTVIIGFAAVGVGLGQFLEAYRATFKEDL
jgi:fumarate reductase subunit D